MTLILQLSILATTAGYEKFSRQSSFEIDSHLSICVYALYNVCMDLGEFLALALRYWKVCLNYRCDGLTLPSRLVATLRQWTAWHCVCKEGDSGGNWVRSDTISGLNYSLRHHPACWMWMLNAVLNALHILLICSVSILLCALYACAIYVVYM